MLARLSIQNVVLIDRLDLDLTRGFSALTGETGAGKSIVLDALGLALGMRAEARLVRAGADQASVTASFDVPPDHGAFDFLKERGMATEDSAVILRRTLTPDGRSKAFVNDQPAGVQLLRDLSALLVEIHGQFETQGLLDAATHRDTLDSFGGFEKKRDAVAALFDQVASARLALKTAQEESEQARQQEDFLRFAVDELETLDPKRGEEAELADLRTKLLSRERQQESFSAVQQMIDEDGGLFDMIGRIGQRLTKIDGDGVQSAFARLKAEAEDLSWQLQKLAGGENDARSLAEVEERYFALKECARKHRVPVDDLAELAAQLSARLKLATDQERQLAMLSKNVAQAEDAYLAAARDLSALRQKAARKFAAAVNAELPDLKLERAVVDVVITTLSDYAAHGIDHVEFRVSTNVGSAPGPLGKIASGGELGRLMLAMKTVLAATTGGKTMIFDEVDSGIGGATAAAVGARIKRLSADGQVLVVTHSPQVAALADRHFRVEKRTQKTKDKKETTVTDVVQLSDDARREEIARMLSGAEITAAARAQADLLLNAKTTAGPGKAARKAS
jgi:DNA repair protein RecN (Recombination protein N)